MLFSLVFIGSHHPYLFGSIVVPAQRMITHDILDTDLHLGMNSVLEEDPFNPFPDDVGIHLIISLAHQYASGIIPQTLLCADSDGDPVASFSNYLISLVTSLL